MESQVLTLGQTVGALQQRLTEYIEAAYHIRDAKLVEQRKQLLGVPGVIHQLPFVESTPRYVIGARFGELGLDEDALELLEALASPKSASQVFYNPPYQHQAEALKLAHVEGRNLVITTGTGSGKTESFLLPLVAKLASEAAKRPDSFKSSATRVILLYPMNALVNDQVGRLRLLLGDSRVTGFFGRHGGRPARFARYTSRTPYAGVRDKDKDQQRLSSIKKFYIEQLELMKSNDPAISAEATKLFEELSRRGKWPAKPDLRAWYGRDNTSWQDRRTGEFLRAVTQPDDVELLTRHEVLASPPDVLVTNYSMLEYMLMRPIEAPIFDQTARWLKEHPDEKLLLVVDEAHLYRGAGGSEVALLLRRLRMRLGIGADRVQAICTSASFDDVVNAKRFASQLTGLDAGTFAVLSGELLRRTAAVGGPEDAEALATVDIAEFYQADTDEARMALLSSFLEYRGEKPGTSVSETLMRALRDFRPLGLLVNETMKTALSVESLPGLVFPQVPHAVAEVAVSNLMALASLAREKPGAASLLPCRVHSFHRGLPGLWVCMDPDCDALDEGLRGGPAGKLYSQPREFCECGARVLELYTCRACGTAYAKAYTDDPNDPEYLWSESGQDFVSSGGVVRGLEAVDLLLEHPLASGDVQLKDYDLVTGRIDPEDLGDRHRRVYLPRSASASPDAGDAKHSPAEFARCAVCDDQQFGSSRIQDHQTKGDEPFQALLSKQIEVQAPGPHKPTPAAPLRGRKVLIFSDSRQSAARLAPNLQRYATKDAVRPLLVYGFRMLQHTLSLDPSLDDAYFAVLIAGSRLGVILDPEMTEGASFSDDMRRVNLGAAAGAFDDSDLLAELRDEVGSQSAPPDLIRSIHEALADSLYGLESLALASVKEHRRHAGLPGTLPDIPGVTEGLESRTALMRAWLSAWRKQGYWLSAMPQEWWSGRDPVGGHKKGDFRSILRVLNTPEAQSVFKREWLPQLLQKFCSNLDGTYRAAGRQLSLDLGTGWGYCGACRNVQRLVGDGAVCTKCGKREVEEIDPETDAVFLARKSYYRSATVRALRENEPPVCLRAEEHTAQLNSAAPTDVFSLAERYELLFQDIQLSADDGTTERAVDVLSCTTTMEVGIDIGALSGVSLRNMPPARSNYQQRAGRAGRRGDSVATVTAFGSADSHDEHYFSKPAEMISGSVEDPTLVLDNRHIIRRHMTAYLLQRYVRDTIKPEDVVTRPNLFSVLGSVEEFLTPSSSLSRAGLEVWLSTHSDALRRELNAWLPDELAGDARTELLGGVVEETLRYIDEALVGYVASDPGGGGLGVGSGGAAETGGGVSSDSSAGGSEGSQLSSKFLLDRLLYKGVLPRYAFPTDVATFYVFDQANSTKFLHQYEYAPQQGLSAALSQYAPAKSVWVDGKLWRSGALYSPVTRERFNAWRDRELYLECERCGYAMTKPFASAEKGETLDCPGCGQHSLGPAQNWMRPPGFAHPVDEPPSTARSDSPPLGYPTRAKLTVASPEPDKWKSVTDRIRVHYAQQKLVVTNRGAEQKGYNYCTKCGRIEPAALPDGQTGGSHRKPFPDDEPLCPGGATAIGMVLGTDFYSDVLLVSLKFDDPVRLIPGVQSTRVALRTACEALRKAACDLLEIEPGELMAEFRPALTELGERGQEAELYLYDTLSGGAGFARMAGGLGERLFVRALEILENCPEDCDSSCYRCLRSYKNKFEHDSLDRHLGASLLNYVLTGHLAARYTKRIEQACDLLFADLEGYAMEGFVLSRNEIRQIPDIGEVAVPILCKGSDGREFAVCVSGALTPGYIADEGLRDLSEYGISPTVVEPVDEYETRVNLPHASAAVRCAIGR